MVNQLRTLLLNAPASEKQPFSYPGEELVSDQFAPARLLPKMEEMLRVLYGDRPDRARKNFGLRQVLGMVQATELSFLLSRRYPLVTTPPWNDAKWRNPFASTNKDTVLMSFPDYVNGEPVYYSYNILCDGSNYFIYPLTGYASLEQVTYPVGGAVTLPGSGAIVVLPEVPHHQFLEIVKKPKFSAGALLDGWSTVDTSWLFGTDEFLRNIWTRRDEAVYRIAVATVALAERIDDMRGNS